ncbi:MAG: DUF4160 domain-containing protein [Pirellulaceae bacterium]|nr:DUF4160 domain-containing protein [Pirellulaceae bacterium]
MVEIETGAIIEGSLPKRASKLIAEWSSLHRAELIVDWELAESQQPLVPIDPLD